MEAEWTRLSSRFLYVCPFPTLILRNHVACMASVLRERCVPSHPLLYGCMQDKTVTAVLPRRWAGSCEAPVTAAAAAASEHHMRPSVQGTSADVATTTATSLPQVCQQLLVVVAAVAAAKFYNRLMSEYMF